MQEEAWTAVAADATAAFLTKCARNPGRWFYPCSANHREPRRCAFEFRRASEDNTAPRRLIVRVEECAYTEGGTGWRVWPCALLLAGWLVAREQELQLIRRRVLELGCGLGLPGLTAAVLGADSAVTDCLPVLLRTVERSARANDGDGACGARVAMLDWDDESPAEAQLSGEEFSTEQGVKAAQLRAESAEGGGEGAAAGVPAAGCARLEPAERFDLLLASDVIYSQTHARQLPAVLARRAAAGARLCAMVPVRSEEHTRLFFAGLAGHGVQQLSVARVDAAWVARVMSHPQQREAAAPPTPTGLERPPEAGFDACSGMLALSEGEVLFVQGEFPS